MFTLIKSSALPQVLTKQLPGLVISLIIAETFYKFGSFTLECVAFLGTWFLIDLIIEVSPINSPLNAVKTPAHKREQKSQGIVAA
jgi:hypothetical protein